MIDSAAWGLALAFAAGLVLGLVFGLFLKGRERRLLRSLLEESERQHQSETDALLDGVKMAFVDISSANLRQAGAELLRQSETTLNAERRLHDQQLKAERSEFEARAGHVLMQLERMQTLIRELEKDRSGKFNELATQIRIAGEGASDLAKTTQKLAQVLGNARVRGQWGERMADDVLRALGLQEGINYQRQQRTAADSRPDFSFMLPQGRLLHMDVKFPFDNYARLTEATDSGAAARYRTAFLRDVRQKIGEVSSRSYIAPEDNTLDIALLFIPNEAVFAAIFELDPGLLDDALKRKVLMVSPVTLYAVLSIVRQACELYRLDAASREILDLMTEFGTAWASYQEEAARTERKLEEALDQMRSLTTSRRRKLDRQLQKIENLKAGDGAGAA